VDCAALRRFRRWPPLALQRLGREKSPFHPWLRVKVNHSSEHFQFTVSQEQSGQRLDRFLVSQLPQLSRSRIQSLMDEARVLVGGIARKPSHHTELGEIITVEIPPPPPPGVPSENIPLDVLYEDEDLLVVNKPAGLIVHPGSGVESGTLVAALLHRAGGTDGLSTIGGPMRPGIVHRLDKGTSGAIIIARTDAAHKKLVEAFRERQMEKIYVALLHGKVKGESGRIDLPVARDLQRRSRMTARRREGREARTDWRVLLRIAAYTLVQASLHTGRTHQIRVHFSAFATPVVGDTVYGAPAQERVGTLLLPPLGRNFLHAARIAFLHPRTGKRLEVRAPLPAELTAYARDLSRATNSDPGLIDAALREFL
jgi:23S rRNA pseudouridine1911/1915/1917 synthase